MTALLKGIADTGAGAACCLTSACTSDCDCAAILLGSSGLSLSLKRVNTEGCDGQRAYTESMKLLLSSASWSIGSLDDKKSVIRFCSIISHQMGYRARVKGHRGIGANLNEWRRLGVASKHRLHPLVQQLASLLKRFLAHLQPKRGAGVCFRELGTCISSQLAEIIPQVAVLVEELRHGIMQAIMLAALPDAEGSLKRSQKQAKRATGLPQRLDEGLFPGSAWDAHHLLIPRQPPSMRHPLVQPANPSS